MRQVYPVILAGLVLAACASAPQLERRPGGNPLEVDLSGEWVLRDGLPRAVQTEQTIRVPSRLSRTSPSGARPPEGRSRSRGPSVNVFLESGSNLKVTQTDYGLFFSFDRAIVEEYTFGEKRLVNVGPIEAQRVSGWEGAVFVAETMDEDGNLLTERWTLDEDGALLVRTVSVSKEAKVEFENRQVFVRD